MPKKRRKEWLYKNHPGYEAFVEDLKQLALNGYSMMDVTEMYGTAEKPVSKGAVAGCAHRNGITFCSKDPRKAGTKKTAPSGTKKSKDQDNVLFFQPKDNRCQWPIGDPKKPDFHLCGRPDLVMGLKYKVYCQEHFKLAYQEKKKPALPFQF